MPRGSRNDVLGLVTIRGEAHGCGGVARKPRRAGGSGQDQAAAAGWRPVPYRAMTM